MDLLGEYLLSEDLAGTIEYDPWTDTIVLGVRAGANLRLPVTPVPTRVEEVASVGSSVYNDSMPLPVRGGGAIYRGRSVDPDIRTRYTVQQDFKEPRV